MITMSPDHVYTLTLPGQQPRVLPSNTQILKDRGIIDTRWYNEAARERGTYVHGVCDVWNKARMDGNDIEWSEVMPERLGFCRAWVKFCMETGFKAVLSEQMLWHSADFATTIDAFGYIGSPSNYLSPILVEIKTGSEPKWVWLQMALQEQALLERLRDGYIKVPGVVPMKLSQYPHKICVVLKEDGTYKVSEKFNINHTGDAMAHVRSYHSAREYA